MESEIVGPWRGCVTVVCEDGIERVIGWYGSESSAQYVADKYTANGKYKGARAWACIGNYGTCIKETAPPASDLEDDEPEPEGPAPAVTLDKWGIE